MSARERRKADTRKRKKVADETRREVRKSVAADRPPTDCFFKTS